MELTGGYFGGYYLVQNNVELNGIIVPITNTPNPNEFFVTDELNNNNWYYRIEQEYIVFIGFNNS